MTIIWILGDQSIQKHFLGPKQPTPLEELKCLLLTPLRRFCIFHMRWYVGRTVYMVNGAQYTIYIVHSKQWWVCHPHNNVPQLALISFSQGHT